MKRSSVLYILKSVAVVNMVAYHTLYDVVYIFGVPVAFMGTRASFVWQQAICWTFILVSGALSLSSRKPYRRAAVVFGCGLLLTAVTYTVMPSERISFGILHFLGAAAFLTALLRPALNRIPAAAGAVVSAALFAVCYTVPHGHLAFFGTELPDFLYNARWLFFAGFMPPGFYSADYFPLIPWLFLFWTGLFAWRIIGPKLADVPRIGACEWISRRALLIYLLHQPVAYGILFVCFSL